MSLDALKHTFNRVRQTPFGQSLEATGTKAGKVAQSVASNAGQMLYKWDNRLAVNSEIIEPTRTGEIESEAGSPHSNLFYRLKEVAEKNYPTKYSTAFLGSPDFQTDEFKNEQENIIEAEQKIEATKNEVTQLKELKLGRFGRGIIRGFQIIGGLGLAASVGTLAVSGVGVGAGLGLAFSAISLYKSTRKISSDNKVGQDLHAAQTGLQTDEKDKITLENNLKAKTSQILEKHAQESNIKLGEVVNFINSETKDSFSPFMFKVREEFDNIKNQSISTDVVSIMANKIAQDPTSKQFAESYLNDYAYENEASRAVIYKALEQSGLVKAGASEAEKKIALLLVRNVRVEDPPHRIKSAIKFWVGKPTLPITVEAALQKYNKSHNNKELETVFKKVKERVDKDPNLLSQKIDGFRLIMDSSTAKTNIVPALNYVATHLGLTLNPLDKERPSDTALRVLNRIMMEEERERDAKERRTTQYGLKKVFRRGKRPDEV